MTAGTTAKVDTHAAAVCAECGVDVSSKPRFKTTAGNYYCEACHGVPPDAPPVPKAAAPAAVAFDPSRLSRSYGLLAHATCPHCWHVFPPQDVLWVAAHADLVDDPVLGKEKARRFLPTRFTVNGEALDARGVACHQLACPRCHLGIPRSSLEAEPLFLSIIGGPKTGKSYLLAAMTWELRKRLPSAFAIAFNDADTVTNQQLSDYEATLFLAEDAEKPIAIAKTEETGDFYDQANIGGHTVSLPRPFLFNVRPAPSHMHAQHSAKVSRLICLYDNAGESFQPGKDSEASPVTQHLTKSGALMFLFDPTQDPRFREKCRKISADPQLTSIGGTQRQETLLVEAGLRIRRYSHIAPNQKHQRPLLVLVPKSDVWGPLLDEDVASEPILPNAIGGHIAAVDVRRIERVSQKLRALLLAEIPELVGAAEDLCQHVVYIPVSALGHSPEATELAGGGTGLLIRPADIAPRWAAAPLLYMFAKWTTGLIGSNAYVPSVKTPP